MTLIRVEDLHLEIAGKTILEKVDLDLQENGFLMVIGPNGAGKSSLVKCILALFDRYRGEITIAGTSNRKLDHRSRARLLGYVPQSLELQFNLDVFSFLELSRFAHQDETSRERNRIIDESLALTETDHLKNAFLDELSGGERQRVLIASALAQKPRALLLDEPSQSLDPSHRLELTKLLARLHEEERLAILVITHEWNELLHLKPDILAMKAGEVAFRCGPDDLDGHLSALFDCEFHHLEVDGRTLSFPRFS
jgi:iron complex transport system ATP-binding protein